jgi:hypothetical protein
MKQMKEGHLRPSFVSLLPNYFLAVFLAGFAALPLVPHFLVAQAMIKPPSCAERMK